MFIMIIPEIHLIFDLIFDSIFDLIFNLIFTEPPQAQLRAAVRPLPDLQPAGGHLASYQANEVCERLSDHVLFRVAFKDTSE